MTPPRNPLLGSALQSLGYLIPNDEKENARLDLLHAMVHKILDGRLSLAPIGDAPGRVIDLCTGTGLWAMEFGSRPSTALRTICSC